VENSDSIITVNRSSSQPGLVRIQPSTDMMTVLDSSAQEAREIFAKDSRIAYRVGTEIRLLINQKVITLLTNAKKLRTFESLKTFCRITFENQSGEVRTISFKDDGKITFDSPFPGMPRSTFTKDEKEFVVFQTSAGLFLGRFGSETESLVEQWTIEKGSGGEYVAARYFGDQLFVAYFDELLGVLKLALSSNSPISFSVELVDGTPGETYRGHDIAMFAGKERPGLVYLDARALKTRYARYVNSHWESSQLPIQGAVGFYNQILKEESGSVRVASHNFRSQLQDFKQSFENLALYTLNHD
jgi:hypothetical protein